MVEIKRSKLKNKNKEEINNNYKNPKEPWD
jgi:hypothetical protein